MNEKYAYFKASSGSTTVTVYHMPEGAIFKDFGLSYDLLVQHGDSVIVRTEDEAGGVADVEYIPNDERVTDLIERIKDKVIFNIEFDKTFEIET